MFGTWIDGKSIYKRTFKDTATAAGYTNIGTIENFDKLIKVDGNYLSTTIGWIGYYSNHGIAGTNISRLYVVDTNGVVKIYVGTSGYSTAAADSAYVTIYYTKTTD